MANSPNKKLNLLSKCHLIEKKKQSPNISQRKLAEEFKTSPSTINRTLKRKLELDYLVDANIDLKRMRKIRQTPNDNLNKIMDEFWRVMRVKNLPLTGSILQSTALKYAHDLGLTDFKASDGWL